MAGHLVSAPESMFRMGEGTDVEPAHFWSQGPLENGVRSWQFIIKQFDTSVPYPDTWCPPQYPSSTSVKTPMWNFPFLEPGSTCEWCQKLAIYYKT